MERSNLPEYAAASSPEVADHLGVPRDITAMRIAKVLRHPLRELGLTLDGLAAGLGMDTIHPPYNDANRFPGR